MQLGAIFWDQSAHSYSRLVQVKSAMRAASAAFGDYNSRGYRPILT